jgi:hypothetical protein
MGSANHSSLSVAVISTCSLHALLGSSEAYQEHHTVNTGRLHLIINETTSKRYAADRRLCDAGRLFSFSSFPHHSHRRQRWHQPRRRPQQLQFQPPQNRARAAGGIRLCDDGRCARRLGLLDELALVCLFDVLRRLDFASSLELRPPRCSWRWRRMARWSLGPARHVAGRSLAVWAREV